MAKHFKGGGGGARRHRQRDTHNTSGVQVRGVSGGRVCVGEGSRRGTGPLARPSLRGRAGPERGREQGRVLGWGWETTRRARASPRTTREDSQIPQNYTDIASAQWEGQGKGAPLSTIDQGKGAPNAKAQAPPNAKAQGPKPMPVSMRKHTGAHTCDVWSKGTRVMGDWRRL